MCFVGDGNNMANSLMVGAIKTGMAFSIACPKGYEPDAELVKWARENGEFMMTEDVETAAHAADVIYTDVWASMGQEGEKEKREQAFKGYQVNADVMKAAHEGAMVLTACPPTVGRRSRRTSSKRTPTKFSTKRKTACTHRRRSCAN